MIIPCPNCDHANDVVLRHPQMIEFKDSCLGCGWDVFYSVVRKGEDRVLVPIAAIENKRALVRR